MGGHCVAFSSHAAAILITFLTLANGIIDLVNGLQWFAAGGSLARGQDIFETIAGVVIDGTSVVSIIVLYSRLKVSRVKEGLIVEVACCGVGVGCFVHLGSSRFIDNVGDIFGGCE
jgi:hypothetical protein